MGDAADAVAKAEDLGRRVRGVTPGAGRREIAPANVAGLEIAEDSQPCVVRGRIGDLGRRRDGRKMVTTPADGRRLDIGIFWLDSLDTYDSYDTWRVMG